MEEKENTASGSLRVNSETGSPPVSGVGVVVNMAVNFGGTTGGGGGGSGDLMGKKKRGRPRKYDSDGNLRVPYISIGSPSPVVSPPPGFSLSPSDFSSKRGRGRPPGSGNWQLLASLGELFANTAGGDFTPHIVTVNTGEDVAAKIISLSQKGPRGICILAANGAVSNVTIRQPGSSGGILTYEGRFEILSLTGSFTISENGGIKNRTGGLSVSLAGPDGRVIGGGIAGLLMAASPIQIVVGSFMPNGYKTHKKKHHYEPRMAPVIQGVPNVVTTAIPISQAAPVDNLCSTPTSQFPVQSRGEAEKDTSDKDNPNSTSTASADWNGSELMLHQRPSPDINMSAPME